MVPTIIKVRITIVEMEVVGNSIILVMLTMVIVLLKVSKLGIQIDERIDRDPSTPVHNRGDGVVT